MSGFAELIYDHYIKNGKDKLVAEENGVLKLATIRCNVLRLKGKGYKNVLIRETLTDVYWTIKDPA